MSTLLEPAWRWPLVCVALTVVLLVRQRGRGVLGLMAVIFLVQALGPVLSHLRGQEIYIGIVLDRVHMATQGFALAIGGLLLAELVVRQRPVVASLVDPVDPRRWVTPVCLLLVMLSGYAALGIVRIGPASLSQDKASRIAAAGGGHYVFLVIALVAAATWPLIRPSAPARRLYLLFLTLYVVYCVASQERDFVFVLVALAFLGRLTQTGTRISRLLATGLAAAFAVSALAAGRSAEPGEHTNALFQGSLLFVDTRVLEYVPTSTPYGHGQTYLAALVSALTRGRVGGEVSPTQWLVDSYAPAGTSGYGFSLSGEALLNFGLVGVLPVFFLIGVGVNVVVNRLDRSPLAAHLGYFLTIFVPYMFRSDSRGLMSGIVLCLVLHGGLAFLARPSRPDGEVLPGATPGEHRGTSASLP